MLESTQSTLEKKGDSCKTLEISASIILGIKILNKEGVVGVRKIFASLSLLSGPNLSIRDFEHEDRLHTYVVTITTVAVTRKLGHDNTKSSHDTGVLEIPR